MSNKIGLRGLVVGVVGTSLTVESALSAQQRRTTNKAELNLVTD